MSTVSRQPKAGTKPRSAPPSVARLVVSDELGSWAVPAAAAAVILASAALATTELVATPLAVGAGIVAALVLVLYLGLQAALSTQASPRDRMVGTLAIVLWLSVLYLPFHLRLFPGTPLLSSADLASARPPLLIPAAGRRGVDLVIEGRLPETPGGSTAIPVTYRFAVTGESGARQVIAGRFDETLRQQRLGRRGQMVSHQMRVSEMHAVANPAREDLLVVEVAIEPAGAPPVRLTAFPHRLPSPIVLTLGALALLSGAVAFDRAGPGTSTDGGLTVATTAAIGTAAVFATSNASHPTFSTFVGSAIFGGPIGFAAGTLLWWVAKRVLAAPAR